MDIFLLITGFLLTIIGVLGSILPVLPGPPISWVGLLLLQLTSVITLNYTFLGITLAIAIIVTVIDYIIPAIGTKKFGGSKYGVTGSMIGLVIGIFMFPPFGLIVGPFIGAYIGELIKDSKDKGKAFKAAVGSFIGFVSSTLLKFIVAVAYTGLFIAQFWEHKAAFFNF